MNSFDADSTVCDRVRTLACLLAVTTLAWSAATLAQTTADGDVATPDRSGDAVSPPLQTIPVSDASPVAVASPVSDRHLGPSTIDEIVVTAQKRAESINDVPISISAFSGEDLAALGVTDTRDLSNLVPGFSYGDSGYGVPIYSLRGVGFNDPSQTASSTVGVYADEFSLPFPVFTKGANLDVQRVEVLKGPQGTLYGRNTTGGLINYIANRPTDHFEAGTHNTFGRFQSFDTEDYVSGPLTDTLGARLAYRGQVSGQGWQHSNTRPDDTMGKQNQHVVRLLLDWQPSERFKTSLMLNGWLDRGDPQAPQAIGIRPQNSILGGLGITTHVRNYPLVPFDSDDARVADWTPDLDFHLNERFGMAGLRTDWTIVSDTALSVLGSYANYRNDHSVIPQSGLDVPNAERNLDTRTTATSLEARLSHKSDVFNWMLGGYFGYDHVDDFQVIYIGSDSAGFPLPTPVPVLGQLSALGDRADSLGNQVGDTYAGFANADWAFADDWKVNVGVRYTSEKRDFKGCSADDANGQGGIGLAALLNAISLVQPVIHPGTPIPLKFAGRGECASIDPVTNEPGEYHGDLDESNVSYRTALNWSPVKDALYYLSYSRGFKSGSFPVLPSSSQAQYEPVVQERLDAYEIGGKTAFFNRRLRVNFAGFYYDYRDKQLIGRVQDLVFGPLPILVNVPKSKVLGAELELQTSPFNGLYLTLNGTYLHTEIGHYSGIDEGGNERDLNGKPFNYAPKFGATFVANYIVPVFSSATVGIGGDYSYRSKTNAVLTQDPLYEIDAYGLLGLHADYMADAGWSLGLFVRNLTDRFYTVGTVNSGDAVARFAGMPRTYGLSFSYVLR